MVSTNGTHQRGPFVSESEVLEVGKAIHDKLQKDLQGHLKQLVDRIDQLTGVSVDVEQFRAQMEQFREKMLGMYQIVQNCETAVVARLGSTFDKALTDIMDKRLDDLLIANDRKYIDAATQASQGITELRETYVKDLAAVEARHAKSMDDLRVSHAKDLEEHQQAFKALEARVTEQAGFVHEAQMAGMEQIKELLKGIKLASPVVNVAAPDVRVEMAAPVVNFPENAIKLLMPDRNKKFLYHPDGRPDEIREYSIESGG